MAKKKKKEKKKKQEEEIKAYSLDEAFRSAKTTETTLQSLMKDVSSGKDFVHPKKVNEEEKITPHLTHESKAKIAEEYALEDTLITKRKTKQKKRRVKIVPDSKEEVKPTEPKKQTPEVKIKQPSPKQEPQIPTSVTPATPSPPKVQIEVSAIPSPDNDVVPGKEEKLPTVPIQDTSVVKEDSIYFKLSEFFENLLKGYNERYERWENSISNILSILRKMRKITKKNTEDLTSSINNLYQKIQAELEIFKIKRGEVEKVAEVDIESMSGEFKRVLGLLELQVKGYQLKRETDDLIHELRYLS